MLSTWVQKWEMFNARHHEVPSLMRTWEKNLEKELKRRTLKKCFCDTKALTHRCVTVQNMAARLVYTSLSRPTSPCRRWRAPPIKFKSLMLTFRVAAGSTAPYLNNLVWTNYLSFSTGFRQGAPDGSQPSFLSGELCQSRKIPVFLPKALPRAPALPAGFSFPPFPPPNDHSHPWSIKLAEEQRGYLSMTQSNNLPRQKSPDDPEDQEWRRNLLHHCAAPMQTLRENKKIIHSKEFLRIS